MPALRELTLRHPTGVTPILIGRGALEAAGDRLADWAAGRSLFVVTTPRVEGLHGGRLAGLAAAAARHQTLTVPEGEAAKTLDEAGRLWEALLAGGGKRDSRLIAFGGGSVGDLGGFVAGCFLRGVEVVQVPTTLLAQVDASVGGKTAIDLPAGKNTVGLFHHPAAVVADTETLGTLPREELRAGLVEAIKMALVLDPDLLERIERDLEPLLAGDAGALEPVVAAAAAAKVGVVERDSDERGERRVLNLGHTLGHALEGALGYRGLRHGEAVAYGLLFALRLAVPRGLDPAVAERTRHLLARLGLPPLPGAAAGSLAGADLIDRIGRDKKAREGGIAWVLPTALGAWRTATDVGSDELNRELAAFLADPWDAGSGPRSRI